HTRFSRDWSSDVCSSDLSRRRCTSRIAIDRKDSERARNRRPMCPKASRPPRPAPECIAQRARKTNVPSSLLPLEAVVVARTRRMRAQQSLEPAWIAHLEVDRYSTPFARRPPRIDRRDARDVYGSGRGRFAALRACSAHEKKSSGREAAAARAWKVPRRSRGTKGQFCRGPRSAPTGYSSVI